MKKNIISLALLKINPKAPSKHKETILNKLNNLSEFKKFLKQLNNKDILIAYLKANLIKLELISG